jgi:hypothetical protein
MRNPLSQDFLVFLSCCRPRVAHTSKLSLFGRASFLLFALPL